MISFISFARGWNDFFYGKTDAGPLCLFRILLGVCLVLNGLSVVEDFQVWYGIGNDSLVPLADSLRFYGEPRINLFQWLTPTEDSSRLVLTAYLLSSVFVLVGYKTRISTIVCFLLLVSLQNRNYAILNSGDTILRCLLFPMIFAPAHVLYSVDSLLKTRTRPYSREVFLVTIRLLQLQFSIVYLATTLFKLKGYDWVDGTAVYYTSRLENFQRIVLPVVFDYPLLVKSATWFALFVEFAMGTLVWVKELRPWVLLSGLLLHLGIELTMSIGFFEWIMVGTYLLFLTPREFSLLCDFVTFKNLRSLKRPKVRFGVLP
jgi:uncharacterized membrane protein YphA (DoxX/SURF4 family)